MKRNQRPNPHFVSPFLALFAVIFIMVAAFPANVLAAKASVTIRNKTFFNLKFGAYDGNDPSCAMNYQGKTFYLKYGGSETLFCNGGKKGGCQVWGTMENNNRIGVHIGNISTSYYSGCRNAVFVDNGKVLTCTVLHPDHPKADEVYCR